MEKQDKFKPTVSWMEEKYNEFNESLFLNSLGDCIFRVKPISDKAYGRFQLTGSDLYIERWSGRLYINIPYGQIGNKYVNSENFFQKAQPMITLNENYLATDEAWENTLVHEMCHYYTYKDGRVPKQGHGPEFRRIADRVAMYSDGRFSIQRLATAEESNNYELDQNEVDRLEKKFSNIIVILVYRQNGSVEMTITKKKDLVGNILTFIRNNPFHRGGGVECCKVGSGPELAKILIKYKYTKTQNSYRYYSIEGTPILNELNNVKFQNVYYPEQATTGSLSEESVYNNTKHGKGVKFNQNWNLGLHSPFELMN